MKAYQTLRKPSVLFIFLVLLSACDELPQIGDAQRSSDSLEAAGVVEAVEITMTTEVSGRVAEVFVSEGDIVAAGDRLLRLEDSMLEGQRREALASLEAARADAEMARAELASVKARSKSAELAVEAAEATRDTAEAAVKAAQGQLEKTVESVGPAIDVAEANLDQAKARLSAARSELGRAVAELERLEAGPRPEEVAMYQFRVNQAQAEFLYYENLHFEQYINKHIGGGAEERARYQREMARNARDAAQAQLELVKAGATEEAIAAARSTVGAARAQVTNAQAAVDAAEAEVSRAKAANADVTIAEAEVQLAEGRLAEARVAVRQAEANVEQLQATIDQAQAGVVRAEKAVAQAQAALDLVDLQLEKLVVRTVVPGTIMTRDVQPGEVIQPGMTTLTLGRLDELTVTVYVPENQYGRVGLGDQAQVTVDSFPDRTFDAVVTRIADEAEYTPRNVQTKEERQTIVYAVELAVQEGMGQLKPGMPADVVLQ